MDYTVLAYFGALCIFSGLLFGTAPALSFSRVDLNEVLKDGARSVGKHRGGKLSSVLVIFQFSLTLVLLTGAGVFVHSLLDNLSANRAVLRNNSPPRASIFPKTVTKIWMRGNV